MRLFIVIVYAIVDFVIAVYRRFTSDHRQNVSFTAHLAGAIAGLLVGIIVLKNRQVHAWELKLKMGCIISFGIFILRTKSLNKMLKKSAIFIICLIAISFFQAVQMITLLRSLIAMAGGRRSEGEKIAEVEVT